MQEVNSSKVGQRANRKLRAIGRDLYTRHSLVLLLVLCLAPRVVGQAVSGSTQTATVTLSSGQLQHLKAAPVQLVAAPGTDKMLNLISLVAQYKFKTAPYTIANGGDFNIRLGTTPINVPITSVGFIDQSANQIQMSGGSSGGNQYHLENQPLIVANDGSAEWTDGDGSVIVTAYYTVVDLQ